MKIVYKMESSCAVHLTEIINQFKLLTFTPLLLPKIIIIDLNYDCE